MVRRFNKYAKRGQPRKLSPLEKCPRKKLGGIPMTIKKGKIVYAEKFVHHRWNWGDPEQKERSEATTPIGTGSFIRRHIFDTRFPEETEDERRKREYKEWAEANL